MYLCTVETEIDFEDFDNSEYIVSVRGGWVCFYVGVRKFRDH